PTAASLRLVRSEGASRDLAADHIIAATGYRLAARSLRFSTIAARSRLRRAPTLAVLPASSPQFQASILILACLHFQPPMGVTRNSILILITPGGMVLDHPLFVGSFVRQVLHGRRRQVWL